MGFERSRQLYRLPARLHADGSPLSARLLRELADFTNTFKSRCMGPVFNDAWPTAIRKSVTTTGTTFALYPSFPLHPGIVEVRARIRARITTPGGDAVTWTLRLRPMLFVGANAPSASAGVAVASTSFAHYDIAITDLTALALRPPWTQDCYVALQASKDGAAQDAEVSNIVVYGYGRDTVTV